MNTGKKEVSPKNARATGMQEVWDRYLQGSHEATDDPDESSDVPPYDGTYRAEIEWVNRQTVREEGRNSYQRVTVFLSVLEGCGGCTCARVFPKVFDLNTASAVAEIREFFAKFDYPLACARDLAAACKRASEGTVQIRVKRKDGQRAHVKILRLMKHPATGVDPVDTEDIWNHGKHWRRRIAKKDAQKKAC